MQHALEFSEKEYKLWDGNKKGLDMSDVIFIVVLFLCVCVREIFFSVGGTGYAH